ncbi:putative phage abortive infection protein [Raoultella terrigena]|uniref:putative phage abortive infection protein n=1 Tax=Raoultella terrigena TaxID=577 RepID=UPI002DBFC0CB|nr:putative phage abortive infection protein [Raoultella terrigena]MEB8192298.1 putative phage abortive infection protein [Raoultella terrigena]
MFFRIAKLLSEKIFSGLDKVFCDGVGKNHGHMIDLTTDGGFWNRLCGLLSRFRLCRYIVFERMGYKGELYVNPLHPLTPVRKRIFISNILSLMVVFFISILLIIYCFYLLWRGFLFDLKKEPMISFFSAVGTCMAAIYAARSAKGVFLSNKSIEENNKNESFDRIFSVLLEQHSMYLDKVNVFLSESAGNKLFSVEYLRDRTIGETLDIVHGDNKVLYEAEYCYECATDGKVKRNDGKDINPIESERIVGVVGKYNEFARNTLSPYMRILYHILKSIHESFGRGTEEQRKKAKQYSNIVRSTIPSDLLFLIAINSAGFLIKKRRLSLHTNQPSDFFSDYYKYHFLLKEYDFFEHLPQSYLESDLKVDDTITPGIPLKDVEGVVKVKNNNRVLGAWFSNPEIYGFHDLLGDIVLGMLKERSLRCICFFYGLGGNKFKVRKYFKNKYVLGVIDSFDKKDVSDLDLSLSPSSLFVYERNESGYISFMSVMCFEMIISGDYLEIKNNES